MSCTDLESTRAPDSTVKSDDETMDAGGSDNDDLETQWTKTTKKRVASQYGAAVREKKLQRAKAKRLAMGLPWVDKPEFKPHVFKDGKKVENLEEAKLEMVKFKDLLDKSERVDIMEHYQDLLAGKSGLEGR